MVKDIVLGMIANAYHRCPVSDREIRMMARMAPINPVINITTLIVLKNASFLRKVSCMADVEMVSCVVFMTPILPPAPVPVPVTSYSHPDAYDARKHRKRNDDSV